MEHTIYKEMLPVKPLMYFLNPKILLGVILLNLSSGLFDFVTKYMFSDFTYLKFLVIACSLDLITGITKVWVNDGFKAITSRGIRATVSKVVQYGSFIIITHVLTHFQINGQSNPQFTWLDKIAYEFLILIEIKSVYENIIKINPKLDFVEGVIKKIVEIFKPKKDENK